jgi:hypothetical protein
VAEVNLAEFLKPHILPNFYAKIILAEMKSILAEA